MACSPEETKSGKLVIRYNASDTGMRPINPCTGYWLSPDIWLEGGIDSTTAKVGVPNTVKVRVRNVSSAPISDVNVQVWVCDYTLGVSPTSGIPSAGGSSPKTGFVGQIDPGPANAAVIDCGTWTPAPGDTSLNGGHVCLAANCFAESPADGAPIPPSQFRFCCDSHHGQRNIAVRAVPMGQGAMRADFRMLVANPQPDGKEEAVFTVQVMELPGEYVFGPAEQELIASGPYAKLEVRPSKVRARDYSIGSLGAQGAREIKVVVPPHEPVPIALRASFSDDKQVGTFHAFELSQFDAKGETVGGARVLALFVP